MDEDVERGVTSAALTRATKHVHFDLPEELLVEREALRDDRAEMTVWSDEDSSHYMPVDYVPDDNIPPLPPRWREAVAEPLRMMRTRRNKGHTRGEYLSC